jgi:Neuraminidase (sialidase)
MKNIFLLASLLLVCSLTFAQDTQQKWSIDRRMTSKPPIGKYTPLPGNIHWENPNHDSKIYNTQIGSFVVSPNIRVLPNSNQQDEVILVRHPSNQLIMFGSANTTVGGSSYGQGSYITTDGGVTWSGTDLIPGFSIPSDPGPAIDKNGTIILTTLDGAGPSIFAVYSTNNGATWSSSVTISAGSNDKNFAASDDIPASPFYGRSYCVWTNFSGNPAPIVISYTTDGGATWSSPTQINNPSGGHYSQGCDIAIGPNGEVYITWAAPNISNLIESYAGFAKSTDGGVTWTVTENAFAKNGIRAPSFNGWNFRVNSFMRISVDRSSGARNGWIYLVSTDINLAPAGSDADVILHRSTDGGTTWSAGIRVNQDALNNGAVQFFPVVRVDEQGGVNICYYDNRNYPSVGDSCETFMSRSTDGGNTWVDFPVSDHRWLVAGEQGLGNYGGDYIGITSGNGKIWPFWFDNKSGSMQAWTASVDISGPFGISNNNHGIPKEYSLGQNYPNPFNPGTNIKFQVPKAGNVKLTVYDMLGNEVALLVNNFMQPGSYSTDFNASSLASGVYFYKIEANNFSDTKKMILVK